MTRFPLLLLVAASALIVLAAGARFVPSARAQSTPAETVAEARQLQLAADSAAAAGRYDRAAALYDAVVALRPGHPTLLLRSASARAAAGELDAAQRLVRRFAGLGMVVDLSRDSLLAALPDVAHLQRLIDRHRLPVGVADTAFSWPAPAFAPEGITFDSVTGHALLGSLRNGSIVRYDGSAPTVTPFAGAPGWSLLGLVADPDRRRLYAAAQVLAMTESDGAEYAPLGDSELLIFDLDDGRLIGRASPDDTLRHAFGDLTLLPDGDVAASDGTTGTVWRLDATTRSMRPLSAPGALVSPQGLAVVGHQLIVADYSTGLHRIDLDSGALAPVSIGPLFLGLDGLAPAPGGVVAVQNGIRPYRVLQFDIEPDGRARMNVLLANDARLDEPTQVYVQDRFVYVVANAPWPRMGRDGHLTPDGHPDPLVLRIELSPPP